MISLTKKVVFFVLTAMLFSCSGDNDYSDIKKKIVEKFEGDSLKLQAALFLYENSKLNYSYYGDEYKLYAEIIRKHNDDQDQQAESLKQFKAKHDLLKVISDTLILSADYIIKHVDLSVDRWKQMPWRDRISFENFCQYVLPYKVDNEYPELWVERAFTGWPDSLKEVSDIRGGLLTIAKGLSESKSDFKVLFGDNSLELPPMPYSSLKDLKTGTCDDLTNYGIYTLRAHGFPVAKDFTPHWANRGTTGHTWCAMILDSANSIPFNFQGEHWRPYLGSYKWKDRLESKVYRFLATVNPDSHASLRGPMSFLSGIFNNPKIIDVTDQYVDVADVSFKLEDPFHSTVDADSFSYISVFSRMNWVPVGWGKVSKDLVTFDKVVKNAIYLPCSFRKGTFTPIGYPFVAEDNVVRFFRPDYNKLQTVQLTRKYPLFENIKQFMQHMVDGKFQGANKEDFSDTEDLYIIKEDPGTYYNEVKINSNKKFKYFRYVGAKETWSNVGEIEFYGINEKDPKKGRVIGAEGSHQDRGPHAAFDGNPVSFYEGKGWNSGWVGMAYEEPIELRKIRFIARTDYNIIVEDNIYELMLWDNEWRSLGVRTATSSILEFQNVPLNSLLLLRNLSGGKEERIFTYENGKQVWW